MEQIIFELSKVPDFDNYKVTRLTAYQDIKKRFFELAAQTENGAINVSKFYKEVIIPNIPEGGGITYSDARRWCLRMNKYVVPLLLSVKLSQQVRQEKTLLEKEHEKLVRQAEIRQDVTDLMGDYIGRLKSFVSDSDKMGKLTHKEMLELYKVIREEEDRSKSLGLKERAENRADLQFAFFISQARAGQLIAEDIEFMEASIKEDLLLYKTADGTYHLPTGNVPKIQPATANPAG